ncbi:hypothetical protein DT019_18050 [Streptomyces sp. SDr-06]|nr:hypothetical protein DT019_18050 [Streptomyces sp. SDr-06]
MVRRVVALLCTYVPLVQQLPFLPQLPADVLALLGVVLMLLAGGRCRVPGGSEETAPPARGPRSPIR